MSRIRARNFPAYRLVKAFSPETEVRQIADILGTSRHTVYKWLHNRLEISEWAADKYAVKLGMHPSEVWPDWFDHASDGDL